MSFQGLFEAFKKNLLIAVSVIAFAGSMSVYLLHMDKKALLESEIERVNIRISTMLKNIKNSKGLEEDIEAIEKRIEELDQRMFDSQELATNYNYFFNIEADSGIEVSDLKQVGIAEEKIDPRKRRMPRPVVNSYEKIRYHMKATGRYRDLVNFLRKLESGRSFYRLEKFRIAKSESGETGILSLDISFLMLGEKAT